MSNYRRMVSRAGMGRIALNCASDCPRETVGGGPPADDHVALALCRRPGTHGTDQARRRAAGRNAVIEYWLSTIDKNISFHALVDLAKMRWRVERDYQEVSRKSGSAITRDVAGPISTITPHYASRSTDSWSPKGRRFPLRTWLLH